MNRAAARVRVNAALDRELRDRKTRFADLVIADFDISLTPRAQADVTVPIHPDAARLWLRERLVDVIRDECVA